jgi:hypothetical protein
MFRRGRSPIKGGLLLDIGKDEIIGYDDKGFGKTFNLALMV